MKKQNFFLALLMLLLISSAVHAQFRIYNSELLKVGDINEVPFISKGFEASMPNLLLKSDCMGWKNTASLSQWGKHNQNYALVSGIKVFSDTVYIMTSGIGVKFFMEPPVTSLRGSSITLPGGPGSSSSVTQGPQTRIESISGSLFLGSKKAELASIYSNYYWSSVSTGIQSLSDARYKTNVRNMENAMAKINQLRPVRFDYLKLDSIQEQVVDPARSNRVGFIAQELLPICPEAVWYNETDDVYSIDYSVLIPFLIKALQEQQAEIDELKKSIH